MKRLVSIYFFAVICFSRLVLAADVPPVKTKESGWLSEPSLTQAVKKMVDSRFMPFKITGKKDSKDMILYQVHFKPFSEQQPQFYFFWGMTNEWYLSRKNGMEQEDFQEIWHQSFRDVVGTEIHQAIWQKTIKNEPVIFTPRIVYKDEEHERNVLSGMLSEGKYQQLEQAIGNAFLQYKAGKLSPNILSARMNSLANLDGDYRVNFDAWVQAKKSGYAYLARGMFFETQAWETRGTNFVADIPKKQFSEFHRLAALARVDLLKANEKISDCAICAGELIGNNKALNLHETDRSLLKDALRQDVRMWSPVLIYFGNLYPQWGGSVPKMESFIDEIQAITGDAALVDQLYSRMYYSRGNALHRNDPKAARIWYEKGVNGHSYQLLINELALMCSEAKEYKRAAELLEKSLATNNEWDIYTLEALAKNYFAMGLQAKGEKMLLKRDEANRRFMNSE